MQRKIHNFGDFTDELFKSGFSMAGGNADGIYAVINWGWQQQAPYETRVAWHTGDAETDPWEWRMRVLDEGKDIAYGKVFFKKSGFITREWYPFFLSVRRGGRSFEQVYRDGLISHDAKKIYCVISEYETLPLHAIKDLGGYSRENKSAFDRGLVELQMGMFITMCGRRQKLSKKGEEYGWSSTVFCTTETFWGNEMLARAEKIPREEAIEAITDRVLELNPDAKRVSKFICG